MNFKQVLVVRKDLKMRMGKTAAQAAHASLSAVLLMRNGDARLKNWLATGQTKICVYVESEEELRSIFKEAQALELPTALITDSGKTEFNGVPTITACAVGPDNSFVIDTITGKLKLL